MITYSEFIRIRRLEQEDNRTLTKLTDENIADMKDFIAINKRLFEEAKMANDAKRAEEVSAQIKNALNTLDQIINTRNNKIANIAVFGADIERARGNMTSQEIVLFDNLSRMFNDYKGKLLREMRDVPPKEQNKPEESKDGDKVVVKIVSDVPRFVWRNDKSYGPFSVLSVVELDREVADILIKSGKAIGA